MDPMSSGGTARKFTAKAQRREGERGNARAADFAPLRFHLRPKYPCPGGRASPPALTWAAKLGFPIHDVKTSSRRAVRRRFGTIQEQSRPVKVGVSRPAFRSLFDQRFVALSGRMKAVEQRDVVCPLRYHGLALGI